jgi:hypothetical protein
MRKHISKHKTSQRVERVARHLCAGQQQQHLAPNRFLQLASMGILRGLPKVVDLCQQLFWISHPSLYAQQRQQHTTAGTQQQLLCRTAG